MVIVQNIKKIIYYHKKIIKFEEYEIEEERKKYEEGYAFEENDRLNCINLNEFEEYYTKDNRIIYDKYDSTSEEIFIIVKNVIIIMIN
jgi:hypothetical protein